MKRIALVSIYTGGGPELQMYARVLYELMGQRKPEENISHEAMPSFQEHLGFIQSRPYDAWYVIQSEEERSHPFVGAIYLTRDREIGIGILDLFRRQHYASAALDMLMRQHPNDKFYANINPDNYKSKELFKRHGFKFYRSLKGYRKDEEGRMVFKTVQDTFIKLNLEPET